MRFLRWCLVASLGFGSVVLAQRAESLLIGPGDVVHVVVFDTPELEQHGRITDAGNFSLTMGGDVKLAGLTPAEASRKVERALKDGHFLRNPMVNVIVEEYATLKVSVVGEVRSPGAFSIGTPRSILDVITLAGGLTETADRKVVIRRRASSENVTYVVPNTSSAQINSEVQVYPGDTVVVPKAGIVYILGDVRLPGGYTMTNNEGKLTVLQLVARAGGTNTTAVPSHARIIRKTDAELGYVEQPLPLSAMQKGKRPDLALQPEDIIFVPFSYLRSFVGSGASNIASSLSSAAVYRF